MIDPRRVAVLARAADEALVHLGVEVELHVAIWALLDPEINGESPEHLLDALGHAIAALTRWTDVYCSSAVLLVLLAEMECAREGLTGLDWGADAAHVMCRAAAVWEASEYVAASSALREAADDLLEALEQDASHERQHRCTDLVVVELTKVCDHSGGHLVSQLLRLFEHAN